MRHSRVSGKQQPIRFEDIALTVLGCLAGPLLWWMSQTWQHNPAATSVQTMEYWIALLCGVVGIGLSALWCIMMISAVAFAIAVKTKNKIIGYWADRFTPKFLQRLIISVIGLQLTFGSQAVAAEHESPVPSASASVQDPFMPELANVSESPAPTPSVATPQEPDVETTGPSPTPQPRQSSQITLEPTSEPRVEDEVVNEDVQPMPRQVTSIPVPQATESDSVEQDTASQAPAKSYTPQQPVPSPNIAPWNPDRQIDDPTLVVQRGDNLWDIAHQELGEQSTLHEIDQRWRQWWQYNHQLLGDNPHALTPGTVLKAPPFTH